MLDRNHRLFYLALGLGLFAMLLVGRVLTPNEHGIGTHEQLGLPPCTFYTLFGLPCPACGMTTSWSYLMRGQIDLAWSANPGGVCLAVLAAISAVWCILISVRGQHFTTIRWELTTGVGCVVLAITLVSWALRFLG